MLLIDEIYVFKDEMNVFISDVIKGDIDVIDDLVFSFYIGGDFFFFDKKIGIILWGFVVEFGLKIVVESLFDYFCI